MSIPSRILAVSAACTLSAAAPAAATYLYADPDGYFPIPEFANAVGTKKQYSEWNVFYSPHTVGNYPDVAAPHGGQLVGGVWQPVRRSQAGFSAHPVYSPADPLAFWDTRNATIRQTNTAAFIASPDGAGNIYSFGTKTGYVLSDSTADATSPYKLGTVMFQFQTDGTLVDFSTIKLRYTSGGVTHSVAATEHLREFLGSAAADPSAVNAFSNRVALQWNLTGLNIDTYEIVWESQSSSMSFQKAVLDTSDTYGTGVPESRTWTASTGHWTAGANWQQGTSSIQNANVKFGNATTASVTLDANRTIGEMIFQSAADVTITPSTSQKIVSNTGISTLAEATGTYVVNAPWEFGATNMFEINAGTVRLNGPVSGNYGMLKKGEGKLVLGGNGSFSGGVTLWGGTLRLEGANTYAGGTAIITGRMEVASNSPLGSAGAFGTSTAAITLGADGGLFANVGGGPAALFIDGDRTVAQSINLAAGNFEKRIGAVNANAGAVYSGTISFGAGAASANNVKFTAQTASDRMVLSGAVTGGRTSDTLTIDGAGTVVLSGVSAKNFASATTVASGTLEIATGASFTGAGNWQVASGAKLHVNGTFAGSGALALNGGTIGGSGTIQRSLTLDAGDRVAPGPGVDSLTLVGAQTWAGGGGYEWQIANASGAPGTGWDLLEITGTLNITASAGNRFTIFVESLDLSGFDGASDHQWIITTASGGITGFSAEEFLVDASGFVGGGDFDVIRDGNSLLLTYAAVPEPSTMALLGAVLAIGAVVLWRKRDPHFIPNSFQSADSSKSNTVPVTPTEHPGEQAI